MEDFYFIGWLTALIIGFVKMVIGFSVLNSMRMRNLKKIGLYFHPFSGQFRQNPVSFFHHIFYVFYLLLLAPIFSWLSVISGVWPFIAMWANKIDVPEKVKEIQFKLASSDLAKEEILKLQNELEEISGCDPSFGSNNSNLGSYNENENFDYDKFTLSVGDKEWPEKFEIDPKNKKLNYNASTPDYDSVFNSVYEYKFDAENVLFIRTIEDSVDNYGKVSYNIKDNVVLTSEIREQCDDNRFMDYDEEIVKCSKAVEWSKVEYYQLRFFIMSHHKETFSDTEFRKIVRKELERIKSGRSQFEKIAIKLGCNVKEEENYTSFQIPENCSVEKRTELNKLFEEDSLSRFNITYNELQNSKQIVPYLLELLGEKIAA